MKVHSRLIRLFVITGVIIPLLSCNEDLPAVKTARLTDIRSTTAIGGGEVEGSGQIINRGICWSKGSSPTVRDSQAEAGSGSGSFICNLLDLTPETTYYVRAFAETEIGISYGNEEVFETTSIENSAYFQIIADHTVVDKYEDIPQYYIDKVKGMFLSIPGESHSKAYSGGLISLYGIDTRFKTVYSYAPTDEFLRVAHVTWGDYSTASGWVYTYGEEDWFTNTTAIARTKAGITYCNENGYELGAMGFGWCSDMTAGVYTATADSEYGCRWSGVSVNGPEGSKAWGLDAGDYSITGNSVNLDTYLYATQQYVDYCKEKGYKTKIFFTTGPVDSYSSWSNEKGFQGHLKHERIRSYANGDPERILFDYADILCWDDNGVQSTTTWNGHTYPKITVTNGTPEEIGHISRAGSIRIAKAMWWMLARMAGWDGISK